MILGKRPRPPIKRTTSMTEFTLDVNHTAVEGGSDNAQPPYNLNNVNSSYLLNAAGFPPRNHRRNSADYLEKPHFLTVCHFCNRRLISGRDIFMYKGDGAYCSFECRQQQMNQDEKKDKQSSVSKKSIVITSSHSSNDDKTD